MRFVDFFASDVFVEVCAIDIVILPVHVADTEAILVQVEAHEALFTPRGSPRVLDQPVVMLRFYSLASHLRRLLDPEPLHLLAVNNLVLFIFTFAFVFLIILVLVFLLFFFLGLILVVILVDVVANDDERVVRAACAVFPLEHATLVQLQILGDVHMHSQGLLLDLLKPI